MVRKTLKRYGRRPTQPRPTVLASPSLLFPRPQLDEETLADLTWAFIAIDLDHSGTIDPHELSTILAVLSGDLHLRKGSPKHGSQQTWKKKGVKDIMAAAKAGFKQYRLDKDLPDLPDQRARTDRLG